jgi:hypothetical protein
MQSEIDGTGLKVNPIGLGAMPLSIGDGPDGQVQIELK